MSDNIQKLSDYNHVRLRTEMYFGSRTVHTQPVILYDENGSPYLQEISWVPALYTTFREIFDNSLDEVIGHGYGNKIEITYNEQTKEFSIRDNGRGIPIDWDPIERVHKATLVLTNARAGRNFGEREFVAGTNGIGGSGVVFCSEYFNVEILRDNKRFTQEFSQGNAVIDELIISKPIIKDCNTTKTGTFVKWKLSDEVFKEMLLPEIFIKSRIFEIAAINPQVQFYYNSERIKVKPNSIMTFFNKKENIILNIKSEGFSSKFILIPSYFIENDFSHSIVNNIPAFNGGNHIDQFKRQFFSQLLNSLEKESKKRKLQPTKADLMEKLFIFNITEIKAPNFDSQSKTRLINDEPVQIIKEYLNDEKIYKEIIKKHRSWIEEIYLRCSERTTKKEIDDIQKATKKLTKRKVPKLMEASSTNRKECILFLAEGDSAIAGMAAVRDPKIHAGLPLRGKVLNVNGESIKKVLENVELMNIMTVLNLKIGEKASLETLRYGKIYLATDADPDGSNIAALLINFFYSYWPELFEEKENPIIYIFLTPFIIAEKGKERRYWYSFNYNEFNPLEWKGWTITRAKGLGSLTTDDWRFSLRNPEIFPIVNDGKIKESLDLIFNNNRSDDRKIWISL